MSEIALEESPDKTSAVRARRLARAISWIGHPLVFVTGSVAVIVAMRLANRVGLSVLLALLVAVVLPTILLLSRGVRSGQWSDADVSVRTERARFYPQAMLISSFGLATLLFLDAPAFVTRGALVTLALLAVAALVNCWIKLSLHALFGFYCALILLRIHWLAGTIAFALALLVFWSRLHLGRHGLIEMLVGAGFGLLGGVLATTWP